MNVINRFTWQSLKRNKKWTVVTIIGVIISTAMIAAVSTFVVSLMDLMQRTTIAETGNWQAEFDQVQAGKIPVIAEDKLTKEYMLSRNVGYAKLAGSQNPNKPYLFIKQYDDRSLKNFPIKLLSGRLPQNDREIVLSEQVAATGKVGYKVGDQVSLAIGERQFEGKSLGQSKGLVKDTKGEETFTPKSTATYTVVGIIAKPGFEPSQAPGYTAITYLDAGKLASGDTVNVSIVAQSPGRDFYSKVEALAQKAGVGKDQLAYNSDLLRYYGVISNDNLSQALYQIMYIVIAIIMIASVSLIYNAFAISVAERTRQLGMLASVGATKRQKRQNVYFEGFLIGLAGIPLGILAGIGGIGITLAALNPLLRSTMNVGNLDLRLVVSWQAILIAVLFSALTIFISVYIPARRASRIMPIDAIRQSQEIKLTAKTIRTAGLTRRLFGFEGELALKNLKRNRKKYRATILSLIISLVLFLTVSMYGDLINRSSDMMLGRVNFDLSVNLNNSGAHYTPDQQKAIYRQIAGLDTVKEYAVLNSIYGAVGVSAAQLPDGIDKDQFSHNMGVTVNSKGDSDGETKYGYSVGLYSLDDAAFARYAAAVGADAGNFNDTTKPQAILINQNLSLQKDGRYVESEAIKAKVGDTLGLTIESAGEKGDAKEAKYNFQIGAITQQRPLGISMTTAGQFMLVTNEKTFTSLIGAEEEEASPSLVVKTDDSGKLETEIQSVLQANSVEYVNGMIYNNADNMKKSGQTMLFLGVLVYGFIILISLICIANIFNTISTNVALRRKEFAMLRSVGMTPKSFNKMIRFESIFYGLKALLYGLPLSVLIAWLLNRAMDIGISQAFTLPWKSYGVAILLVFVIVAVTMLYSIDKIKKENIIDALKDDSN